MNREFSSAVVFDRQQARALIREARDGSTQAVGQLIDACRNYLLHIARQEMPVALRAKIGPSDLVQDAAFEAQRDFASFEGEQLEQLLAWLRRILLNNTANIKRQYQHTDKRDISRERPLAFDAGAIGEPIDQCLSPGAALSIAEQQARVNRALERLPADMQAVIVLRNREHLSFQEIGIRMERAPDAARKLWARAIEQLRKELHGSHEQT